jgi:glycosyltransferase involved in cell wall biosynthesis
MPDDWPSVSIILPVRNEGRTAETAVRSALAQEYPRAFEVVVAEGRSLDKTRAVLETMAASEPRLRVVDNPTGTTPAGLNAAIRASTGDVVVRCDGHSVLPSGYVRRAVELLLETGADNVGGVQAATGETPLQRAVALGMSIPMGVGDARFHLGGPPGPVDTVFLGVFRRAALERVGMFDEALLRNQDSELNVRLRATGGVVYFHPDLRVGYHPRASLRALWSQYLGSGRWKRATFRRSGLRALRPRQAAPPALVAGLIASPGLALAGRPLAALAVPALYGAALALTALWTAARRRNPAALLLPIVLPIMHVGWGLGFLVGPVRRNRSPKG